MIESLKDKMLIMETNIDWIKVEILLSVTNENEINY